MSLFEKLFRRNTQTTGMAPYPEDIIGTMQPGLQGPGGFMDAPQPDPMMMNQPIFQNFREQEQMVGLANVTLDNNEIIEEFASKLRGYRIKYELDTSTARTIRKVERYGRPFCNDDGINELVGDLRVYLSKGWMLSNIPTKEGDMIKKICLIVAIEIGEKLAMNVNNWSVDRTRMSTVVTLFVTYVWSNIMRSYEDGERTKLYPTQKNIQMTSTLPHLQQQKKSVLEI